MTEATTLIEVGASARTTASGTWSADIPDLYSMKVAWALLRICANDPRFVDYLPHEQAETISFFRYLDHEPTGGHVVRARELLGAAA